MKKLRMKKLSRELSRKKEKLVNTVNDDVNYVAQKMKARVDLGKKEINEIMLDDKNIKECTSLREAYESTSFRHFFAKMASKLAKEKKLDDDLQNPKFWEDHITFFLCMNKPYLNMSSGKVDHVNAVLRGLNKQHYADTVLKRAVSIKGGKMVNKDEPGSYIRNDKGELTTYYIFSKLKNFKFESIPFDFASRSEIVFDKEAKDWKNTITDQLLYPYLKMKKQEEEEEERRKREEERRKREEERRKREEERRKREEEYKMGANEREQEQKKREQEKINMTIEINKELKELDISMPRVNTLSDISDDPAVLRAISYVFSKGGWRDKDMKTIAFWEKNLPLLINRQSSAIDKGAITCLGNHLDISFYNNQMKLARNIVTNNGYSNNKHIIDSRGDYFIQLIRSRL